MSDDRWVDASVLPERGVDVIVAAVRGNPPERFVTTDYVETASGEWRSFERNEVTHWMYFPELPDAPAP